MTTVHNGEPQLKSWPMDFASDALQQGLHALLCKLPWKGTDGAGDLRSIGVTSCYRHEGVSTVAAEFARLAARFGERRVLLVDFNLHHPSVHQTFEISICPGLADVLRENSDVCGALQASSIANLSLLPAGRGKLGGRPVHYDPAQLPAIVQGLKDEFDLVVFDMPAVLEEASASGIAALLDGVLLVVEAERVRWEVARCGQQILVRSQARLLGAVLNKRQQPIPNWLYRRL